MKRILLLAGALMGLSASALAQEAEAPAPEIVEAKWEGPVVTLQTSMGDIQITLDMVGAPKTAAQFLGLVRQGHYNGAAFYRVEPNFLIQLGDLDANGKYRAPKLPPVPLETEHNKHERGAIAMAHGDDPNSGQSTIFINVGENDGLGANADAPPNTTGFAAFGHVTAGMDVVDAISQVERAPEGGPFPGKLPLVPVVVNKAVVEKAQ